MRSFGTMMMVALAMMSGTAMAGLKDGETIVFLGDSIIQAGAGETGYVTLFRQAIEKSRPNSGIKVIRAGISGNRVPNLEERLDRDVLAHKPSVVVIYIGINDVWHSKNGRIAGRDSIAAVDGSAEGIGADGDVGRVLWTLSTVSCGPASVDLAVCPEEPKFSV